VGNLQIKIGIHYGRVIAGVIGHHKPQFSLIGDTVNTTSRVCSTGEDGQITISERAYEQADMPELSFEQRVVEAKGKGVITTYQVSTEVKVNRRYRRQKLNQDPKKKLNKKISVNIIEEEVLRSSIP
jgi:class 3 adenylate cyclase